jgi:hypothetical protein
MSSPPGNGAGRAGGAAVETRGGAIEDDGTAPVAAELGVAEVVGPGVADTVGAVGGGARLATAWVADAVGAAVGRSVAATATEREGADNDDGDGTLDEPQPATIIAKTSNPARARRSDVMHQRYEGLVS